MKITYKPFLVYIVLQLFSSVSAVGNLEEITTDNNTYSDTGEDGNSALETENINEKNDDNEENTGHDEQNVDESKLRDEKYLKKIASGERIISVDDIVENVTEENLEKSKLKAIENGKEKAISYLLQLVDPNSQYAKQANNCIDSYEIKFERFIDNTYEAHLVYNVDINKLKNKSYYTKSVISNDEMKFDKLKKIIGTDGGIIVVNVNNTKTALNTFLDKLDHNGIDHMLYSISHNEIKLYETDEILKFLQESKYHFFRENESD